HIILLTLIFCYSSLLDTLSPPLPVFLSSHRHPPISTLFPYTTLFRSILHLLGQRPDQLQAFRLELPDLGDRAEIRQFEPKGLKRSEEHTSELQSRGHLVCRLLLEKKKK